VAERSRWVRETRFGTWFLGTGIWLQYVLDCAVSDLDSLLGTDRRRFRSILDAGCGHGQAFRLLEERFHPDAILGVDVDPEMVARASETAGACAGRVEARLGDITALELPDASVDMVFCHQTLHHVRDQERALRELHRVLEPGGVLLLAESCRRFIRSAPVRLFFRHPMEVQRSAGEHLDLLRAAGFEFGDGGVSTPYPWWSRPDLGIAEWLGRPPPRDPEPTLVEVVAFRPAAS
jgi:SAM-dependent methyltransferase